MDRERAKYAQNQPRVVDARGGGCGHLQRRPTTALAAVAAACRDGQQSMQQNIGLLQASYRPPTGLHWSMPLMSGSLKVYFSRIKS